MAHVSDKLAGYLEGGLPESERERVERHLAGCAVCREELAGLKAAGRALAEAGRAVPTPAAAPALWSRVRAEIAPAPPRRTAPWWTFAGASAFAAAALLAMVTLRTGNVPPSVAPHRPEMVAKVPLGEPHADKGTGRSSELPPAGEPKGTPPPPPGSAQEPVDRPITPRGAPVVPPVRPAPVVPLAGAGKSSETLKGTLSGEAAASPEPASPGGAAGDSLALQQRETRRALDGGHGAPGTLMAPKPMPMAPPTPSAAAAPAPLEDSGSATLLPEVTGVFSYQEDNGRRASGATSGKTATAGATRLFARAQSDRALGREAESRASYEAALKAGLPATQARMAHVALGEMAVKEKDDHSAMEHFSAALGISRDASVLVLLGGAYERLGQMEKARTAYRDALDLSPNNRDARAGLERLLQRDTR